MKGWLAATVAALGLLVAGGCGSLDLFDGVVEIGAPSWSPDGAAILFHIEKDGKSEIYRADADGGDVERLTSAGVYTRSPAWSPDGRHIAFARAPDLIEYDIYVATADGSHARRLHAGARADHPEWSADHPSWSPDGTRLAYVVGTIESEAPGRLCTIRANGRFRKLLAPRGAGSPAWSPGGRWIAFSRGDAVFVVRAGGRGRERLVIRGAYEPTWSPNGKRLAVSRAAGIFVVPLTGGRPTRLAIDVQGIVDSLAWSPNGSEIAYTTNEGLYVAKIDGSGERRVAGVEDA